MYDWRVCALMTWIENHKNEDGSLSMSKLASAGHLDQYHYLGLACNDEVIDILDLGRPGTRILDVGCGIGGPARYISWKSGCEIVGVDIQDQLVSAGNDITRMVGLQDRVSLIAGDVCDPSVVPEESFDAFISLLVILHIADRRSLFQSLFRATKSGGGFLIEDMVALDETFSDNETRIAKEVIGAPYLPTLSEYKDQLTQAGFVDIEFESLTPEWIKWCINRSDQYNASREDQVRMHGEKIFAQRCSFYSDVKTLFLSGKLGGFRITGRKPTPMEISIKHHRTRRQETAALVDRNMDTILEGN